MEATVQFFQRRGAAVPRSTEPIRARIAEPGSVQVMLDGFEGSGLVRPIGQGRRDPAAC